MPFRAARTPFVRFPAAFLTFVCIAAAPRAGAQETLSRADREVAAAYYRAVEKQDWIAARTAIDRARGPLLPKALAWHLYGKENSGASFTEITGFLNANPLWPARILLARRAEEAVSLDDPPEALVDWFDRTPPTNMDSWQFYIAALRRLRGPDAARAAARLAWRTSIRNDIDADNYLDRHRRTLTEDDHRARMAMLLRERRSGSARTLLRQVEFPAAEKRLYELRVRMLGGGDARDPGAIEAAIRELPPAIARSEDVLYERIRWHRERGEDQKARELLAHQPPIREHQRRWWIERSIQIRTSLEHGDPRAAYELAAGHKQSGADEAEQAESLAGWIALRHLDEPRRAGEHLTRAYDVAPDAFTGARAAYWHGLADLAANEQASAETWLQQAARHPGTFYGQLAQRRLGFGRLFLPPDMALDEAARRGYEEREITRAARLFMALEDRDSVRIFLWRRIIDVTAPDELVFVVELSRDAGTHEFAVRAARRAIRDGHGFMRAGFPTFSTDGWPEVLAPVERELVFAVARQESSFYVEAGSHAGARGLMQLQLATARAEARLLGVSFSAERLTTDATYNLSLGGHYLHRLLIRYHGNYPLALAAYNAGPRNVNSWIERLGDPRQENVDAVDWIARIPFGETRNYVRRVLQNLAVYRRLAGRDFQGRSMHDAWTAGHYNRCAPIGTC